MITEWRHDAGCCRSIKRWEKTEGSVHKASFVIIFTGAFSALGFHIPILPSTVFSTMLYDHSTEKSLMLSPTIISVHDHLFAIIQYLKRTYRETCSHPCPRTASDKGRFGQSTIQSVMRSTILVANPASSISAFHQTFKISDGTQ